jgi:hypothetical protein
MSNVIQFPTNRKIDVIAGEINNLQGEITTRFETLTKLFVTSRELEKECAELQVRYDDLVMQYAAAIGHENIPAGILEFCSQVVARCDADSGDITLAMEGTPVQSEPLPDSEQLVEQVTEMMKMVTNLIKGAKSKDELQ